MENKNEKLQAYCVIIIYNAVSSTFFMILLPYLSVFVLVICA